MLVENLPKNQKEYYQNKVREFEKRTGKSMNVKGVSKIYDCNIEYVEYNTSAAIDMMEKHGCYIYHDLLAEEDPRSNGTNWQMYGFAHLNGKTYKYYYETKQWGGEVKDDWGWVSLCGRVARGSSGGGWKDVEVCSGNLGFCVEAKG
jgi:hypothetical protein